MIRKVEINWRRGQEEGVIPVEVIYSRRRTMGLEVNAVSPREYRASP